MNRPPVNALSAEFMTELRTAIERAPQEGAKAIVLSGSPGRFSAGLDVPLLLSLNREEIAGVWRELYMPFLGRLRRLLFQSPRQLLAMRQRAEPYW